MRAGRLDEQITIQQFVRSGQSATGTPEGSWTTFATVWADPQFVNAEETQQLSAQTIETVVRFHIRYLAGVSHVMRITWGSDQYRVEAVDQTHRRQGKTIITARLNRPAPR